MAREIFYETFGYADVEGDKITSVVPVIETVKKSVFVHSVRMDTFARVVEQRLDVTDGKDLPKVPISEKTSVECGLTFKAHDIFVKTGKINKLVLLAEAGVQIDMTPRISRLKGLNHNEHFTVFVVSISEI